MIENNSAEMEFVIGAKLEVQNISKKKWYPARMKEIDWDSKEVLVHFEHTSYLTDEWISMDSPRLKPCSKSSLRDDNYTKEDLQSTILPIANSIINVFKSKLLKGRSFNIGECVMAKWNDGMKYPAKVLANLPRGVCEVLFYDGIIKRVREAHLSKLKDKDSNLLLLGIRDIIMETPEKSDKSSKYEERRNSLKRLKTNATLASSKRRRNAEKKYLHDEPNGLEASNVTEGGRKTITINDEKLPPGWSKHAIQRRGGSSAGKWDVFLVSPLGRKFRSRNELNAYFEDKGEPFLKEKFDFSLRQRRSEKLVPGGGSAVRSLKPCPISTQKRKLSGLFENKLPAVPENEVLEIVPQRRIKTILPRIRLPANADGGEPARPVGSSSDSKSGSGDAFNFNNSNYENFKKPSENNLQQIHSEETTENQKVDDADLSGSLQSNVHHLDDECKSPYSGSVINEETRGNIRATCNYKRDGIISNSIVDGGIMNEEQVEAFLQDEPINCLCGVTDEDGLMIQCDICKCWQHATCNNIDDEMDVPEYFSCCFCQHPAQERDSTKHLADQEWITEGKLPKFPSISRSAERTEKREKLLKSSHFLVGELCYLSDILSKLRVKTEIAVTPNHPKLILWNPTQSQNKESCPKFQKERTSLNKEGGNVYDSEPMITFPQPEEAIDFSVCQEQLLKHIDFCLDQAEAKADMIENMIEDLEEQEIEESSYETHIQYSNRLEVLQILKELSTSGTISARL